MHILFVKLSSLGDIVQTMPILDLAHKKGATVDWLVEKHNSSILIDHPYINRLITAPKLKPLNLSALLSTIKNIRKVKYDAVIDFQGLIKSAFWMLFSRSDKKIGQKNCREPMAKYVLSDSLIFSGSAIERYFYLFNKLFNETNDNITELATINISETEKEFIDSLTKGEYMVIAPATRWQSKMWPADHWKKLVGLISQYNIRIFAVGTKADVFFINTIARNTKVVNLSGKTSAKQLFYLFSKAKLAVTLDSGALHLAASSNTKLVSIFGPTDSKLTGPINKDFIIKADISCSPCLLRVCPIGNRCMKLISPEMVMEKIHDCLGSSGKYVEKQNVKS